MKLRVITANFYEGNDRATKDALLLSSLGADLVGIQEGRRHLDEIRHVASRNGYRTVVGREETVRSIGEIPILIKRTLKVTATWVRRISEATASTKFGPERAETVVRFEKGNKKFQHINTHLNANIQDRTTGAPLDPTKVERVFQYIMSMIALQRTIRRARKAGYIVILTGDLNYREYNGYKKFVLWYWSPQMMFRRTGLRWRSNSVDYIAYSHELHPVHKQVIDETRTGSDHDWLMLDFEF